jgi:tetratricopeptide (TPR) repeat protein
MLSHPGNPATRRGSFCTALPWLLGAVGLLLYLATLNWWVSLESLVNVARVAGWDWRPQLHQPLTAVIQYPFRGLPGAWIPPALNLFTAACAGMVLMLLARSTRLLLCTWAPGQDADRWQDCTFPNAYAAWFPSTLAAAALGLQLTFWENATAATGDMLSLLVFAAVIWCLFEFRVRRNPAWLYASALLFAAGMTDNWVLMVYFPMLLAAVIWVQRLDFFDVRFLTLMLCCGLAGLTLYLLLPVVQSFSPRHLIGFWPALKLHLGFQKASLLNLPRGALIPPVLAAGLVLLARFAHTRGESPAGIMLTKALVYLVCAALLALGLFIFFEPAFSPRSLGLSGQWLSQYYLYALVVGYCSGRLLPASTTRKRWPQWLAAGVSCGLLVVAALGLAWQNLGDIRLTNGPALRQFAEHLTTGLPPGPSVVLADDPRLVLLAQAQTATAAQGKSPLCVDTISLLSTQYHAFMARRFKSRWPGSPPGGPLVEQGVVIRLISEFLAREPMFYLNPSFGYYFELLTDRPCGLAYCLSPRRADQREPSQEETGASEQFYADLWIKSLQPLSDWIERHAKSEADGHSGRLARLRPEAGLNQTAMFLGAMYSRSLDDWAVRLQRRAKWTEAAVWLGRALEISPDNVAAWLNLEYNRRRQQEGSERLDLGAIASRLPSHFGKYNGWQEVLAQNGPVDEPSFLFEMGQVWYSGRNYHQALAAYSRCAELAPHWPAATLWQARSQLALGNYASALALTENLAPSSFAADAAALGQHLFCRTTAQDGLGRTNEAARILADFVQEHREQGVVLVSAARVYLDGGQPETALSLLDVAMNHEPNNVDILSDKGLAQMRLARYPEAIQTFTALLSLEITNQAAWLDRALARLNAGQPEAARADYEHALALNPQLLAAVFGLGEVALQGKDTNSALGFYQQCLSLCVPGSVEYRQVSSRLTQLSGGGPAENPGRRRSP